MSYNYINLLKLFWAAVAASVLVACGGGGSGGPSGGEGSTANYPGSIVGERIEFTVTEEVTQSSVDVGFTVVYDFSAEGRVQGTNPQTGQVLEPVRYEYQTRGNNATILLFYEYDNGGEGYEEYKLTGDGSILQGTYEYEAVVTAPTQYSAGKAKGNYRIVPPNNVKVYAAPNAAAIASEQEDIWQFLRREDNLAAVATDSYRNAYVAIQEDGTLAANSSAGSQTAMGGSKPINELFRTAPAGQFEEVELSLLLGMGISTSGDLWIWAGTSFQSPRTVNDLDNPVHSFVRRSAGDLVITGPDRSPEYVCKETDQVCAQETDQMLLDAVGLTDADQAMVSGYFDTLKSLVPQFVPTIVYTDINDGLLKLADSCPRGDPTDPRDNGDPDGCVDQLVLPTGVGQVADFDLKRDSFLVVVETSGQVVASDWGGAPLPLPTELGTNAVEVAISGDHVGIVRADGTVITWRYQSGQVSDVDEPTSLSGITRVESTPYDGRFLFLESGEGDIGGGSGDGSSDDGSGDGSNDGSTTTANFSGSWSGSGTQSSDCGDDGTSSSTISISQNSGRASISGWKPDGTTFDALVSGDTLNADTFSYPEGEGITTETGWSVTLDSSGDSISGSSSFDFVNLDSGFSCSGTLTFSASRDSR